MTQPNRRVLIIDDNRAIHDDLHEVLQGRRTTAVSDLEAELFGAKRQPAVTFELSSAYQGLDGVELMRQALAESRPYALALVDMRMPPGIDGLDTAAKLWELDPDLQVVLCTAYSDASWHDIVQRFGATDRLLILKKPFDLAEVCQLAIASTEKWRLAQEARARMAELVQSRADLAASLALARAVQEATSDGLLVVGPDRMVTTANRRFLEMWSIRPELLATGDAHLMVKSVLDQVVDPDRLMGRVNYLYDHPDEPGSDEIQLKDGRVYERWTGPVRSDAGGVQGRLWWFRDITERRRFEVDRAIVTERMASLGRLAAGVGHEINNPLTYALGNVESLLAGAEAGDGMPPAGELVEQLRETRDGLWRIRLIVRDLQTVARPDEAHGEVDVQQVIEQAIQIAGSELRHRATIVRRYEAVPSVLGSRIRLGQVFLNLIINAAHAMPEGQAASNRIEIAIRDTGSHSIVEVTDTGSGIAPEHIDRVFEPFFTTKDIGAGTGLGLSISREIVASHRGTLAVTSVLGAGTTMTVTLPHGTAVAKASAPVIQVAPATRRAKVLVIDDEPLIGRVLKKGLPRHDVVVASHGKEALAWIARGEMFDVILCDLMMPDISGIDVHEYLAREHPAIASRMVFMTGGAFTSKAKVFLSSVSNARIDKPFSLAQINQLVDQHVGAELSPEQRAPVVPGAAAPD